MEVNYHHHYVWNSQIKDIWEIASELKESAMQVDVYLQGLENNERKDDTSILHKRNIAFPAHRLMLAAASPFLNKVLNEHYAEHHDTCVNVIVPNVSNGTLQYILDFIYCGRINIPLSARDEVLEAANFLQIISLINYFEPRVDLPSEKPEDATFKVEQKEDVDCNVKVPPKWRGKRKQLLQLHSRVEGSNSLAYYNQVGKEEIVDKATLPESRDGRYERCRRKIKSRYDSDIYEVSLPKMRSLQDAESEAVVKKVKKRKRCKETSSSKKESLHTYALKSSSKDVGRNSYDFHNAEGDEDNRNFEETIELPSTEPKDRTLDVRSAKQDLVSLSLPPSSPSIAPTDEMPNLFTTDASYLQETSEIPCTSFMDSPASMTSISKQHFSAPLTIGSSSSSSVIVSQISELPVVSPFNRTLENTSLKYLPEICKAHEVSNPTNEEEEEDEAEEEDGLFKLQVLLKDCEDFPESVTHRMNNPLRCQNGEGVEVKLEEPAGGVDISQWISEEMKSLMPEEIIEDKVNKEAGERHQNNNEAAGNVSNTRNSSESESHDDDKKVTHKCHMCGKVYPDLQSCKSHIKNFHKEAKQMCKHCGKMFRRRCDLYNHERRHDDANLPCENCGKTFKLKKDLAAHLRTHTGGKRYSCTQCNKELSSFRNLRNHIAGVHQKQRSYACHMCNKTYAKSFPLQVHIRSVHTGERPFKCKICSKTFCNPHLLKAHEVSHTGEQKYSCKVCQRRFSHYGNMVTHQRVHSNERPFVCVICKEGYKTRESLRKHKWIHTGLKPLRCPHCSKEYRIKESFERHMLKCHDEVVHLPQIYFEMSEKASLENICNDNLGVRRKNLKNMNDPMNEEGSPIKMTDDIDKKVQDTDTLAAALPETLVPVVQFVNDISQGGTAAIELDASGTGQLHLNSDDIQINYPILSTNPVEVEDNTAALTNITDEISPGTDLSHPIESLLQVTIPGTHSSVIMTEDGKVNILLDC